MPENPQYFPERDPQTIQQATLCFLIREKDGRKQILLAMKKRGFGVYLWNGLGGKVKNEEIEQAVIREAHEEAEVAVENLKKKAILHFYFPQDPAKLSWNQDVHVFFVDSWQGNPAETEEMKPQWFDIQDIPYKQMWDDDWVWLPQVLEGKFVVGYFAFDDGNKMIANKLEIVDSL